MTEPKFPPRGISPAAASRPDSLRYAEKNLGVHRVYEQAKQARLNLEDLYKRLEGYSDEKRGILTAITDREMEIASSERGSNPDMSQAQMDKHLKVVNHNDVALIELKTELGSLLAVTDGCEYDSKLAKADLDISLARLYELGGYFNFLAAVKTHG